VIAVVFDSIDAFYDARGGRFSGESDFGVHWCDGRTWPRYRVSVVKDTGDVYAIRHTNGVVELLGNVGREDAYDCAEEILDGWEDPEVIQLDWARERLARGREE
jgi:hypothetical protein